MAARISVIVPCYNSRGTISKALRSLENQTFKDFETIVVDDASTDGSIDLIRKFKVKAIALKENKGVSFCRNRGVEASSGKLLFFMDSDCWAESDWVERAVEGLSQPGVDVIAGKIRILDSTFFGDAVAELGFPGGGNAGFENMWKVSEDGFTNHVSSCNLGMTREIFEKSNGFDESLRRAQDAYLSFVLSRSNAGIKYLPHVVVYHQSMVSFREFVDNHLMRGKANRAFQGKVVNIKPFVSLRFWSAKNILRNNLFKPKLPLVFSLLFLSFVLQQAGYLREWARKSINV